MSASALVAETGREAHWRTTIRSWLLGRLGANVITEALDQAAEATFSAPYLGWWIFEGLQVPRTGRCLSESWAEVARDADSLLRTWNPRHRLVDTPEGQIDWERTIALGPRVHAREYVTVTSRVGLSDDERLALLGWSAWVLELWPKWCDQISALPAKRSAASPLAKWLAGNARSRSSPERALLNRWAHVAARSRYPLMREFIARTLWAWLKPEQEIDRLPLPGKRDILFQLYAAVCIARVLRPRPRAVRWIHRKSDSNQGDAGQVEDGGLVIKYELSFASKDVVAAPLFPKAAIAGLSRHDVDCGRRLDVLITLPHDPPLSWKYILVEVKSGREGPRDAVLQLLQYRQALSSNCDGAFVLWGMGEGEAWDKNGAVDSLKSEPLRAGEDVWVFSTPESAASMLAALQIGASS